MKKGTIIEFTKERGFGKLKLEDGTVLNFDASVVASFDIKPGDRVFVTMRQLGTRTIIGRVDVDE